MEDEPAASVPPAEPVRGPSKFRKTAAFATGLLRHQQMLVAAMEVLRERKVLTEDDEVKLLSAFEEGSSVARASIGDLVEKLQQANLGKVVVAVSQQLEGKSIDAAGLASAARPMWETAKRELQREAQPFLEQAVARLKELKALEAPTLDRLELISANLRDAGKEVAIGLKGAGREAADELVRRGKKWWMSAETEELERELFDWVLKTLPKAEQTFVRILIGSGVLLVVGGILLAAQQFTFLKEATLFLSMGLLLFLGVVLLNWGIKVNEAARAGRGEIEALARMTPKERRAFLAEKWARRAQQEGILSADEARTVIEETLMGEEAASAPAPPART